MGERPTRSLFQCATCVRDLNRLKPDFPLMIKSDLPDRPSTLSMYKLRVYDYIMHTNLKAALTVNDLVNH